MISSKNIVSLYQMVTPDLLNQAGFKSTNPKFKYQQNNEIIKIEINEDYNNVLMIHDLDPNWAPNEHNLKVSRKLIFEEPSVLFGESGITSSSNKIGVAAHIHSRTTNYQEKIKIGTIEKLDKSKEVNFNYEFAKNTLRGEVHIDFFLYLEEVKDVRPFQANKAGFKLSGNLLPTTTLVIDGIGSTFPILEIRDKDKPLWQIEKNWADPFEDSFEASNIHLKLNVAHPECKRLKDGKTNLSRLYMGDIISQSMAAIINDVLNNSEYSINDADDASPDSIISIVKYWVESFEIDTTDYFTIINTIKEKLDEYLGR